MPRGAGTSLALSIQSTLTRAINCMRHAESSPRGANTFGGSGLFVNVTNCRHHYHNDNKNMIWKLQTQDLRGTEKTKKRLPE